MVSSSSNMSGLGARIQGPLSTRMVQKKLPAASTTVAKRSSQQANHQSPSLHKTQSPVSRISFEQTRPLRTNPIGRPPASRRQSHCCCKNKPIAFVSSRLSRSGRSHTSRRFWRQVKGVQDQRIGRQTGCAR
jgi:hypothetical protein